MKILEWDQRESHQTTLFFGSRHSPCKARLVFDFESFPKLLVQSKNKPGPAQVGAISRLKNSKKTSKCQVLFYSTRKSKFFEIFFSKKLPTQKNGPSGALKSHNAEKLKGGTL